MKNNILHFLISLFGGAISGMIWSLMLAFSLNSSLWLISICIALIYVLCFRWWNIKHFVVYIVGMLICWFPIAWKYDIQDDVSNWGLMYTCWILAVASTTITCLIGACFRKY